MTSLKTSRRPIPANVTQLIEGIPSSVGGTERQDMAKARRKVIEAEVLHLQHQIRLLTAAYVRLEEDQTPSSVGGTQTEDGHPGRVYYTPEPNIKGYTP